MPSHRECLCLMLASTIKKLSKVVVPIYIPPAVSASPHCPASLSTLVIVSLFNFSHSMGRGACRRLQSMGLLRGGHNWATSLSLFTFHFHALEKEMATHSSVHAWRIPGTEEPGGLLSMESHRVGHNWRDLAAAAVCCLHELTLDLRICTKWRDEKRYSLQEETKKIEAVAILTYLLSSD